MERDTQLYRRGTHMAPARVGAQLSSHAHFMHRDEARALALLRQYGRTATAFQTLAPGLSHWFADGRLESDEGFIAYADLGRAWVVAGEPIAPEGRTIAVAEAFVTYAQAQGKRVAFFATEGALAASPRFRRILIGQQPVWHPAEWAGILKANRSLREQLRRARAKRVVVRALTDADLAAGPANDVADVHVNDVANGPANGHKNGLANGHAHGEALNNSKAAAGSAAGRGLQFELERLMQRWLATRSMPAMHFLVELNPFVHRTERQLFVAERDGNPVGLVSLAPVPQRNGWLFEHLLRDHAAPNGTAELLVDHAMRALQAQGATWATLGLAPLAGDVSGWLRVARTITRPFFNFAGLAAFKRKLRPNEWQPIYLAYPRERSSFMAMRDALRAFAGGSLLRFGLHTVVRGPSPLLRALEWTLLPWTLALALWPAEPWFPHPGVKWLWVAFDVLLFTALYRLRKRWTLRAARAVAVAVTADTVLTAAQALFWNISRFRTPAELLMVAIACAGPALAAVVLWGAVRRRRVLSH